MKIDRTHDVPYLAGVNNRGTKVYIDRHLPKKLDGKSVDRFLAIHETTEHKHMRSGMSYQKAHKLAERAEMAAVRSAGINSAKYSKFMAAHVKEAGHEALTALPKDLYIKPYRDTRDRAVLRRLGQEDKAKLRRGKA